MEAFAKACPRCGAKYDAAAVFCQKDGAPLRLLEEDSDPRIGQVLLDQFRIEERIGSGGMGMVYRARQTTLGRDVAIKILHPDLAQNPDAVRRFHREARISTALDHPNIVRVFLFGQLPDGSLYLVMELLRGRPLADLLRVEPRLPTSRALHIAVQVAEGVGEAHVQGIVHRDVKPENIFLAPKGRDPDFVKVLDFGIARLLRADEQTQATQSGLVFGTARYISPEGAAGEATDARSDVYSMGVLTYQMLCGETPFEGSSPVTLLMQHIHERVPHLKTRAGGAQVPDGVADVVMRALSKNPEGRYEDGAHFAEVLREAGERAGLQVRPRRATGEREPSGQVSLASSQQASPPRRTSERPMPVETSRPSTEEIVVPGLPRARRESGGRSNTTAALLLLFAFVLGIVAVAGTFWALDRFGGPSLEEIRADRVRAAEQALAADRLDGDGADTVVAITAQMLAERPSDPDALRLRRSAATHLAEHAQDAAREGHREDAIAFQRRAIALVPDDEEARRVLTELERPPGPTEPSLTIVPAPIAGESVIFTAVLPATTTLAITDRPRFVILRDGRRVGRRVDATAGTGANSWIASYAFAQPGHYTVQFLGGEGQSALRAAQEVDVQRSPHAPTGGGDPPITTQGSLGPSVGPVPSVIDVPVPGIGNVQIPTPFVATPVDEPPTTTTTVAQTQEPTIQPLAPRQPPPLPPAWTSTGN
ncbi:MAG: protein kinase [Sandaracinaceae bacterium]|nr:protein kinase [Sandaracinaceae bacterium]